MQALHNILNIPEYALTEFWIYLGLYICKDTEYVSALNMSHTIHYARSLYKLGATYWEMGIFRTFPKI